eukprot:Pgem_evm1s174
MNMAAIMFSMLFEDNVLDSQEVTQTVLKSETEVRDLEVREKKLLEEMQLEESDLQTLKNLQTKTSSASVATPPSSPDLGLASLPFLPSVAIKTDMQTKETEIENSKATETDSPSILSFSMPTLDTEIQTEKTEANSKTSEIGLISILPTSMTTLPLKTEIQTNREKTELSETSENFIGIPASILSTLFPTVYSFVSETQNISIIEQDANKIKPCNSNNFNIKNSIIEETTNSDSEMKTELKSCFKYSNSTQMQSSKIKPAKYSNGVMSILKKQQGQKYGHKAACIKTIKKPISNNSLSKTKNQNIILKQLGNCDQPEDDRKRKIRWGHVEVKEFEIPEENNLETYYCPTVTKFNPELETYANALFSRYYP